MIRSAASSRRIFLQLLAGVVTVAALPDRVVEAQNGALLHPLQALDADDARDLLVIVRRLIPLTGATEKIYFAIVAALDSVASRSPEDSKLLKSGLDAARERFSGSLAAVSDDDLDRYLQAIERQAFFQRLYGVSLPVFFGDSAVWELIGYEGESFSKGGYLTRGFNDLDWLPEPPATAQGPLPF